MLVIGMVHVCTRGSIEIYIIKKINLSYSFGDLGKVWLA